MSVPFFSSEKTKESITHSPCLFRTGALPISSQSLGSLWYIHTVTLCCQCDKKQEKDGTSSSLQQLAPCVNFTLAHLVEAHSFLSFSPCIELCLSGQPGGRRTQSLLHLSPPQKTYKPLCAHFYDLGPCFLNPPYVLANYTTPLPILTPLLCRVFPTLVPTASWNKPHSSPAILY